MQTVKVKKDDLHAVIQGNMVGHRTIYEEAIEAYRQRVLNWFNDQIDRTKAGDLFETSFRGPRPQDHTDDYEQVLQMLEMSVDDEIELTYAEFRQYVRDEWGWQREFRASTEFYAAE